MNAHYIEVDAEVRYWEDACVNGEEDVDGTLIPLRFGDCWKIAIRLKDGLITNWPQGVEASIHYKVCDAGLYWLQDETGERIAKWNGHYVPTDFLCVGDNGFGDYIIFKVSGDGKIIGWEAPPVDKDQWSPITQQN